jgi:hypothetical protein
MYLRVIVQSQSNEFTTVFTLILQTRGHVYFDMLNFTSIHSLYTHMFDFDLYHAFRVQI